LLFNLPPRLAPALSFAATPLALSVTRMKPLRSCSEGENGKNEYLADGIDQGKEVQRRYEGVK